MDNTTLGIFLVMTVLAANQLVLRLPARYVLSSWFWVVQAVNVTAGSYVLGFGLPGLEHVPPVSWVVGLMFFLRIAQNLKRRAHVARELERDEDASRAARAAHLKARIVDEA